MPPLLCRKNVTFGYLKNVKWRKGYHKSNPGVREFFHTQPLTIIWILNLKLTVTTQALPMLGSISASKSFCVSNFSWGHVPLTCGKNTVTLWYSQTGFRVRFLFLFFYLSILSICNYGSMESTTILNLALQLCIRANPQCPCRFIAKGPQQG